MQKKLEGTLNLGNLNCSRPLYEAIPKEGRNECRKTSFFFLMEERRDVPDSLNLVRQTQGKAKSQPNALLVRSSVLGRCLLGDTFMQALANTPIDSKKF